MKPHASFFQNMLIVMWLLIWVCGQLLNIILRSTNLFGNLDISSGYGLTIYSLVYLFIGSSTLILGGFLLLPKRLRRDFIAKTWFRNFFANESKSGYLFLLGVLLLLLGCFFIYSFFATLNITSGLLGPWHTTTVLNKISTPIIRIEPTWTVTP
jgi:hypothetical protein